MGNQLSETINRGVEMSRKGGRCFKGVLWSVGALLLLTIVIETLLQGPAWCAEDDEAGLNLVSRFVNDYPAAVEKLNDAMKYLKGTGKFREIFEGSKSDEWVTYRFLLCEEKVRYHEIYGKVTAPKNELDISERGYLITPDQTEAISKDQNGGARRESQIPATAMDVHTRLKFYRCVKATNSIDGKLILDHMKDNSWVVKGASAHPDNPKWVNVRFAVVKILHLRNGKDVAQKGEAVISFSPDEDWTVRAMRLNYGEPGSREIRTSVDVRHIPGAGYIVDKYHSEVVPNVGEKKLLQQVDYELSKAEAVRVDNKEFTLKAMGIEEGSKKVNWPLVILIMSGVVLLVLGASRIRGRVKRKGEQEGTY